MGVDSGWTTMVFSLFLNKKIIKTTNKSNARTIVIFRVKGFMIFSFSAFYPKLPHLLDFHSLK